MSDHKTTTCRQLVYPRKPHQPCRNVAWLGRALVGCVIAFALLLGADRQLHCTHRASCALGVAHAGTAREIRRLYRKSRKSVRRGRYESAEVHLQTGIILLQRTLKRTNLSRRQRRRYQKGLFRFSIALTVTYYRFMKRYDRAYNVLTSLPQATLTKAQKRVYQGHLKKLAPKVKVNVVITAEPSHTSLALRHAAGWHASGKGTLQASLWPGKWTLHASARGYRTTTRKLLLKPGQFFQRRLQLTREMVMPMTKVALFSTPANTSVTLSHPRHGTCKGQTPLYVQLPPGRWQVKAAHPKHHSFQSQLQVNGQPSLQRTLVMQPTRVPWTHAAAWASLGVAVVAGSSAVLLTYFAQREFRELQSLTEGEQHAIFQAKYRSGVGMQIWGYVAFGLAGAGLLTSGSLLAYILLQPKTPALHPLPSPKSWGTPTPCRLHLTKGPQ